MTQPPDERDPLADKTPESVAPEDQPTIAWSPGGSQSEPVQGEPQGEPAVTEPAATEPAAPERAATEPAWPGAQGASDAPAWGTPPPAPDASAWGTPPPAPDAPAWGTPPPASDASSWSTPPPPSSAEAPASLSPSGELPPAVPPPTSPIISASPSGVAPEPNWQAPGPAAPAPVVAWETPATPAAPGREGYVIAGMGARVVAYLLDSLIVSIVPIILSVFVIDWADFFRQAQAGGGTATTMTMEVTPQLILVTLIGFAIEFIYFVGFWTSGGQATPAMRLMKMKVVDVATGGVLSLLAATKRFIALGAPLALLALVPALQSTSGVAEFALLLFLFFTTITNDRRQGLHDKWANSLVIRSSSAGDGSTLVGCLLMIVILFVVAMVAGGAVFAALGPEMDEFIRAMESARPVAP